MRYFSFKPKRYFLIKDVKLRLISVTKLLYVSIFKKRGFIFLFFSFFHLFSEKVVRKM